MWKTEGLKQALDKFEFDAAFGGRVAMKRNRGRKRGFSHSAMRSTVGTLKHNGQNCGRFLMLGRINTRACVFPLSNWTELDVWQYIHRCEGIKIVPLYFASPRPTVERDGLIIMVDDDRFPLNVGEKKVTRSIRFRTLGKVTPYRGNCIRGINADRCYQRDAFNDHSNARAERLIRIMTPPWKLKSSRDIFK